MQNWTIVPTVVAVLELYEGKKKSERTRRNCEGSRLLAGPFGRTLRQDAELPFDRTLWQPLTAKASKQLGQLWPALSSLGQQRSLSSH